MSTYVYTVIYADAEGRERVDHVLAHDADEAGDLVRAWEGGIASVLSAEEQAPERSWDLQASGLVRNVGLQ